MSSSLGVGDATLAHSLLYRVVLTKQEVQWPLQNENHPPWNKNLELADWIWKRRKGPPPPPHFQFYGLTKGNFVVKQTGRGLVVKRPGSFVSQDHEKGRLGGG